MYERSKKSEQEKAVIIKNAFQLEDKVIDFALINRVSEKGLENVNRTYEKRKLEYHGNIHGTGCVFSSAITAFLCLGNNIESAIRFAEDFFDEKFQHYLEFPTAGKVLDLTIPKEKMDLINQIKEIYNYISSIKSFSKLIPEVRLNISGALHDANSREDIAGIEGRVTIINGFPRASGKIKFGTSDHTARLILSAKKFDNSINFVVNLKYKESYLKLIQENTGLFTYELNRDNQPNYIREKENSTMQWLIEESF